MAAEAIEQAVPAFEWSHELIKYKNGKLRFELAVNAKGGSTREPHEEKEHHEPAHMSFPPSGTFTKEQGKRHAESAFKAAFEAEVKGFTAEIEGKVKNASMEEISKAIKQGGKGSFAKQFMSLEATHGSGLRSIPIKYCWGLAIDDEGPTAVFKGSGYWRPEKMHPPLQVSVEIEVHIAPTLEGWRWLIEKAGRQCVTQYLRAEAAAEGALNWLVANGIITTAGVLLAGVAGTYGLTSLASFMAFDARRRGELDGIRSWYVRGYLDEIGFYGETGGSANPDEIFNSDKDKQFMKGLYTSGRRDARNHTTRVFAEAAIPCPPDKMRDVYVEQLIWVFGSRGKAESALRQTLEQTVRKLF